MSVALKRFCAPTPRFLRLPLVVTSLAVLLPCSGRYFPQVQAADAALAQPVPLGNMVSRIDELIEARWRQAQVKPVAPASDAEFLRRVYLDLTGVIPTVGQAREFLSDQRRDKRSRLIKRLLNQPRHATHLATTWRKLLLPESPTVQFAVNGTTAGFEPWLRSKLADNEPYDKIVYELIAAAEDETSGGPASFYVGLGLKPEKLAAGTARMFLGVQLQCAQCHDHPFDDWSQKDFWGLAAFFAGVSQQTAGDPPRLMIKQDATAKVRPPDTDEAISPHFLGEGLAPKKDSLNRREQLARWMTSPKNRFFARATVNRAWSMLFGRALVHPVDDMGNHNSSSHPELLDELASYFVQSQ